FHSPPKLANSLIPSSVMFSLMNWRTSSRNFSSSGLKSKSMLNTSQFSYSIIMKVGITKYRTHPLGTFVIKLNVILGGITYGAVQLDAVGAQGRHDFRGIGFCHGCI